MRNDWHCGTEHETVRNLPRVTPGPVVSTHQPERKEPWPTPKGWMGTHSGDKSLRYEEVPILRTLCNQDGR